jgi:hypothetical protein
MASGSVERAWEEQRGWSQAAGRLKRDRERKRALALGLTVVGAVLSAGGLAAGLASDWGKVLAFGAAAAVALAELVRARVGPQAVSDWTRARSIAEAIKSEVYVELAGVGGPGFDDRVDTITDLGRDLLPHRAHAALCSRPLPPVDDVASYLKVRVGGQIDDFYRPRARELQRRIEASRRMELALAVLGALLAAAAGTWESDSLAVWVPVLTTIAAACTAHHAAARREYLLVEYLRTAQELERLRRRTGSVAELSDEQLIRRAEEVISVQNEAWMARFAGGAPSIPANSTVV